jgi:putative polymerase
MTTSVFDSETARRLRYGDVLGPRLAPIITSAAVLYNFVLCFVNTKLYGIGSSTVISVEIALVGMALGLVSNRSRELYVILVLLAAYFYAVMLVRFEFDPTILRDVLIPVAFYFLGRHFGSVRNADRLVTVLLLIALAVALWEWLAVDAFLHYFNVSGYYIARGSARPEFQQLFGEIYQGFYNSTRFDSRTLLPFLGNHRVSGIFLEAPSVGNFGAIVFMWALLRPHRMSSFIAKVVALMVIIILADARLGLYYSLIAVLLYALSPAIRPTMLFVAPFLTMLALWYAGLIGPQTLQGDDIASRLIYAGHLLGSLDPAQVFGLAPTGFKGGVQFANNQVTDSAYTYLLAEIGIIGVALLWALFVYAPVPTREAWRFKILVASYYILALTVAPPFTIKTAALLWFLYGTSNNIGPKLWLDWRGSNLDSIGARM